MKCSRQKLIFFPKIKVIGIYSYYIIIFLYVRDQAVTTNCSGTYPLFTMLYEKIN